MPIVRRAQAPTFNVPGVEFIGLAAPSRGATELAAWCINLAPGAPGQLHSVTREEVFIATGGAAVLTLDGAEHDIQSGDAIIVPAGAAFSLANPHEAVFSAIAACPVGAQAVTPQGQFTPPWME